jgi:hypothetical protein
MSGPTAQLSGRYACVVIRSMVMGVGGGGQGWCGAWQVSVV